MTFDLDDTIAAIASAPGGALRGIVRLSGPQSARCVEHVVRLPASGALCPVAAPMCFGATMLLPGELGEVPTRLYFWPKTRSYTRQPSAELHLLGSPPVLEAALDAVCRAGARLARPGEFTLRAFLAGRLDLTQAEAVLGVIDARSRSELDTALGQLAGGLARPLQSLREQLLDVLAHLEAGLDFVEDDIQFITPAELAQRLAAAADQVAELTAQMQARSEAGRTPRVVLLGLPNVGKSSLLNALAADEAAIVSDVPGTTRDFVGRRLLLMGHDCLVIDTAGVLPGEDSAPLSAAAQRMTRDQQQQADLTLLCLDSSRALSAWECGQLACPPSATRQIVWTKCDLPRGTSGGETTPNAIHTSSRLGQGIDDLRRAIARGLGEAHAETGIVAGTADRCRESLRLAGEALTRARAAAQAALGEELVAAEVRLGLEEIGRVVGAVYTEDVLDRIFSHFCIGK